MGIWCSLRWIKQVLQHKPHNPKFLEQDHHDLAPSELAENQLSETHFYEYTQPTLYQWNISAVKSWFWIKSFEILSPQTIALLLLLFKLISNWSIKTFMHMCNFPKIIKFTTFLWCYMIDTIYGYHSKCNDLYVHNQYFVTWLGGFNKTFESTSKCDDLSTNI